MVTGVRSRCFVLAVVTYGIAFGATPPPDPPFHNDISWKPLSKARPASTLTLGSFELRFEETTLAMVVAAVGNGDIAHQGDAAESIYWLCYTAPNERIWIIAHGEMGGTAHAVTAVTAQRLQAIEATNECPVLPQTLQPVSFGGQVRLGTSEQKALKILGQPSHRDGPWRSFDYQGKVPGNCPPDGFDLLNWLLLKTDHGRVVTIHAGQVTSC